MKFDSVIDTIFLHRSESKDGADGAEEVGAGVLDTDDEDSDDATAAPTKVTTRGAAVAVKKPKKQPTKKRTNKRSHITRKTTVSALRFISNNW